MTNRTCHSLCAFCVSLCKKHLVRHSTRFEGISQSLGVGSVQCQVRHVLVHSGKPLGELFGRNCFILTGDDAEDRKNRKTIPEGNGQHNRRESEGGIRNNPKSAISQRSRKHSLSVSLCGAHGTVVHCCTVRCCTVLCCVLPQVGEQTRQLLLRLQRLVQHPGDATLHDLVVEVARVQLADASTSTSQVQV